MTSLPRKILVETIGTFVFVFIGCAVVLTDFYPKAGYHLFGIAVAHGLALGIMITAAMPISGGHLNPAVTIGLWSVRRIDGRSALGYILGQLSGGVLGALAVRVLLPGNITSVGTLGTPALVSTFGFSEGILLEALLTFILVWAVFGTVVNPEAPKVGGFGIGLVLVFDIMVGGPLTGAAVNPARAFGPALVSGTWYAQPVWWVGPIIGAILAAQLWERVILKK